MEWRNRLGETVSAGDEQDKGLNFLYNSAFGRFLLRLIIRKPVSDLAGWFLERRVSTVFIKGFLRNSGIDMSEYENVRYRSFNDFFTRRIRPECRPIDNDPEHFISPCDCKMTVFRIGSDSVFSIKGCDYTIGQLLRSEALADSFAGGWLLVFRLTVSDYHRYCFPDGGKKEKNVHIQGVYHTVNPIAFGRYAVFRENTREYTLLHSDHFDDIVIMEVGATLVGRIANLHPGGCRVEKGAEKGHFDFGGSTVAVLVKPHVLRVDEDILRNNADGAETIIRYGERIGVKSEEH